MADQEICLYGDIWDWTAQDLIMKIGFSDRSQPLDIRINSNGGSVFAAYGMAAKIREHGDVKIKVDGIAASSAAYLCLFGKSVECLDVSNFMFHRAAMDGTPSKEDLAQIEKINGELRAKLESKVKPEDFERESGVSIKDIFEADDRVEAWINARQAQKIGLVDKVVKLTTAQATAYYKGLEVFAKSTQEKNKVMTLQEIKASHPALFEEIKSIGFTAGMEAEKDRTGSFLAFIDVDTKAVVKGIESGKPITATQISDFSLKAFNGTALAALKKDNPGLFNIIAKKGDDDPDENEEENEDCKDAKADYDAKKEAYEEAKKASDDEDDTEAKANMKDDVDAKKAEMEDAKATWDDTKEKSKGKKAKSDKTDKKGAKAVLDFRAQLKTSAKKRFAVK